MYDALNILQTSTETKLLHGCTSEISKDLFLILCACLHLSLTFQLLLRVTQPRPPTFYCSS